MACSRAYLKGFSKQLQLTDLHIYKVLYIYIHTFLYVSMYVAYSDTPPG